MHPTEKGPTLGTLLMGLTPAGRQALHNTLAERDRQNLKFPNQAHCVGTWLAILMEEVGEAAQAALQTQFGGPEAGRLREEMVQVAAVALQMVQAIDEGRCWQTIGLDTPPVTSQPVKGEPAAEFQPATAAQRDEIARLIKHPLVTRSERTQWQLRLGNSLHTTAAAHAISTLGQLIRDREDAPAGPQKAAA